MSVWLWLWIGWAVYFAVVEGVALFNSKPGDTLSEHVWQFLGIGLRQERCGACGGPWPCNKPDGGAPFWPRRQPSGWTRLRRLAVLAFLTWLVAHFLTGGWF